MPVAAVTRKARSLNMDLSPILRQTVKTQTSSNGELSHGIITKAVHQGVQAGRREAAGARRVDGRSSAGVGGQSQRVAALASGVSPRCGERVSGSGEPALVGREDSGVGAEGGAANAGD